jgi:hypothetical protein
MESPIFISAGVPLRTSPTASKTDLRNSTIPPTSSVMILGVTVDRSSG